MRLLNHQTLNSREIVKTQVLSPGKKKPDQPVDSRITMCAQDLAHTNYIHLNQTNSHTHELCNNDCFRPRFSPLKTHTHSHVCSSLNGTKVSPFGIDLEDKQ